MSIAISKQIRPQKETIYHLEDVELAAENVKDRIESETNASVVTFPTRLELEAYWLERPARTVILDLLVPEKYIILAHILLGRPRSKAKRYLYYMLRPLVRVAGSFFLPPYLIKLKRIRDQSETERRNTYWGGVEFIRTLIELEQTSDVNILIYSLTANKHYRNAPGIFGRICNEIIEYVESLKMEHNLNLEIFAKGYEELSDADVDEFNLLLDQLKEQCGSK